MTETKSAPLLAATDDQPYGNPAAPGSESAFAPFIPFDYVTAQGHIGVVGDLTIEASRLRAISVDRVIRERVIVAHLRGSADALRSLRNAINVILDMMAPTGPGTTH